MIFGLEGKGYHIILSQEFSNIDIIKQLSKNSLSSTGKFGSYLKYLPKHITSKQIGKNKTITYIKKGLALTVHQGKSARKKFFITSKIRTKMVPSEKVQSTKVPLVAQYYEKRLKQKYLQEEIDRYSNFSKNIPWYRKMFLYFLEITLHNSYVLYLKRSKSKRYRNKLEFRYKIMIDLLIPWITKQQKFIRKQKNKSKECKLGQLNGKKDKCSICQEENKNVNDQITAFQCISHDCFLHPECYDSHRKKKLKHDYGDSCLNKFVQKFDNIKIEIEPQITKSKNHIQEQAKHNGFHDLQKNVKELKISEPSQKTPEKLSISSGKSPQKLSISQEKIQEKQESVENEQSVIESQLINDLEEIVEQNKQFDLEDIEDFKKINEDLLDPKFISIKDSTYSKFLKHVQMNDNFNF